MLDVAAYLPRMAMLARFTGPSSLLGFASLASRKLLLCFRRGRRCIHGTFAVILAR